MLGSKERPISISDHSDDDDEPARGNPRAGPSTGSRARAVAGPSSAHRRNDERGHGQRRRDKGKGRASEPHPDYKRYLENASENGRKRVKRHKWNNGMVVPLNGVRNAVDASGRPVKTVVHYKDDTHLGGWGNPERFEPSPSQAARLARDLSPSYRRTRDPPRNFASQADSSRPVRPPAGAPRELSSSPELPPPLGSWGNPEPIPDLLRAVRPSVSQAKSSHKHRRPPLAAVTPHSRRGNEHLKPPSSAPPKAISPSSDDDPTPRHRTVARKSSGGRRPRPTAMPSMVVQASAPVKRLAEAGPGPSTAAAHAARFAKAAAVTSRPVSVTLPRRAPKWATSPPRRVSLLPGVVAQTKGINVDQPLPVKKQIKRPGPPIPQSEALAQDDSELYDFRVRTSSPEPEDALTWIRRARSDIQDPTAAPPLNIAVAKGIEKPPPGMMGKARRRPSEAAVRFLADWLEFGKVGPQMTPNHPVHCAVFEAYIAMATAEDDFREENAPEFTIDCSDHEAPPFELFYTNDIIYDRDVPEPELGTGCDCEGPCNENDQGCLCVRRQEMFRYGTGVMGFNYYADGTLKNTDLPIFECGPRCGCPPECQNRVIQRGRSAAVNLELFKTHDRGWGVRSKDFIPSGTFLGLYAGELITEAECERRGTRYDKSNRTYLFDLDSYHLTHTPAGLAEVDPRLAVLANKVQRRALATMASDTVQYYSAYSVDAFHYGWTRWLNHNCDPNVILTKAYVNDYHPERPVLAFFTKYAIAPNEELCFSYKGEEDEAVTADGTSVKKKQPKRKTTAAHAARRADQAGAPAGKHAVCLCGAKNCDGSIFYWKKKKLDESDDEED